MGLSNHHQGINSGDVYETNRGAVLRAIHTFGPLTQNEIVENTGLKQPTVSEATRELSEVGVIKKEKNKNRNSPGRPPELFELTSELFGIAVRVARHEIVTAFVDLDGEVYEKKHYPTSKVCSNEDLLDSVEDAISHYVNSDFVKNNLTVGVGIAVPGPVNVKSGEIRLVTDKPSWAGVNFNKLQALNNLPVIIRQDADAAVIGESLFGLAKNNSNVIFIAAGRGIGAGIMVEDRLLLGGKGFSGEFGHTSVEMGGKVCSCGNKGCVERYASINALLNYLKKRSEKGEATYSGKDITFQSVIELNKSGNETVREGVVRSANYLGVGIANLVNLYGPGLIILGDEMVQLGSVWVNEIKRVLKKRNCYWEDLQVVESPSWENIFLEGAGALALEKFISKPTFLLGNIY